MLRYNSKAHILCSAISSYFCNAQSTYIHKTKFMILFNLKTFTTAYRLYSNCNDYIIYDETFDEAVFGNFIQPRMIYTK